MPYSTVDGAEVDGCDDDQTAVVKDSDGELMGCHGSEDAANDQIAALEASEDEDRAEGLPLRAFAAFAGDGWHKRLPEAGIETRIDVSEMLEKVSRSFWRRFDDMPDEDYLVPEVHLTAASETEASGWLVAVNRATDRYWRADWTYMDEGTGAPEVEYSDPADWTEVEEQWVPVEGDADDMERAAAERKAENRADPDDLSEGTLVTWGPSNATRYGEIDSVVTSGEATSDTPGDGETTLEASEENPVYRIQHYEPGEDGWEESDSVTVHRAGNLTVIEDFPEERGAPAVHTELEKRGPQLGEYQRRTYQADVRRSSDGTSTTVIINTDAVDAHGTIVDPDGMRLEHGNRRFSRNFFINHDMNLLAGESPEPQMRGGALQVQVPDSAWDHEDELVERWYRKVKKGLLTQASIGFMPIDGDYTERNGQRVYRYDDWMLREWSFVPIASNPEADVTSRQASPTVASRLERKIERLEQRLNEVAPEAPESSGSSSERSSEGGPADAVPKGKSPSGSQATDDDPESGASGDPTRVITVEDARRLLRKQRRKRRQKAEEIAKRKLGMA